MSIRSNVAHILSKSEFEQLYLGTSVRHRRSRRNKHDHPLQEENGGITCHDEMEEEGGGAPAKLIRYRGGTVVRFTPSTKKPQQDADRIHTGANSQVRTRNSAPITSASSCLDCQCMPLGGVLHTRIGIAKLEKEERDWHPNSSDHGGFTAYEGHGAWCGGSSDSGSKCRESGSRRTQCERRGRSNDLDLLHHRSFVPLHHIYSCQSTGDVHDSQRGPSPSEGPAEASVLSTSTCRKGAPSLMVWHELLPSTRERRKARSKSSFSQHCRCLRCACPSSFLRGTGSCPTSSCGSPTASIRSSSSRSYHHHHLYPIVSSLSDYSFHGSSSPKRSLRESSSSMSDSRGMTLQSITRVRKRIKRGMKEWDEMDEAIHTSAAADVGSYVTASSTLFPYSPSSTLRCRRSQRLRNQVLQSRCSEHQWLQMTRALEEKGNAIRCLQVALRQAEGRSRRHEEEIIALTSSKSSCFGSGMKSEEGDKKKTVWNKESSLSRNSSKGSNQSRCRTRAEDAGRRTSPSPNPSWAIALEDQNDDAAPNGGQFAAYYYRHVLALEKELREARLSLETLKKDARVRKVVALRLELRAAVAEIARYKGEERREHRGMRQEARLTQGGRTRVWSAYLGRRPHRTRDPFTSENDEDGSPSSVPSSTRFDTPKEERHGIQDEKLCDVMKDENKEESGERRRRTAKGRIGETSILMGGVEEEQRTEEAAAGESNEALAAHDWKTEMKPRSKLGTAEPASTGAMKGEREEEERVVRLLFSLNEAQSLLRTKNTELEALQKEREGLQQEVIELRRLLPELIRSQHSLEHHRSLLLLAEEALHGSREAPVPATRCVTSVASLIRTEGRKGKTLPVTPENTLMRGEVDRDASSCATTTMNHHTMDEVTTPLHESLFNREKVRRTRRKRNGEEKHFILVEALQNRKTGSKKQPSSGLAPFPLPASHQEENQVPTRQTYPLVKPMRIVVKEEAARRRKLSHEVPSFSGARPTTNPAGPRTRSHHSTLPADKEGTLSHRQLLLEARLKEVERCASPQSSTGEPCVSPLPSHEKSVGVQQCTVPPLRLAPAKDTGALPFSSITPEVASPPLGFTPPSSSSLTRAASLVSAHPFPSSSFTPLPAAVPNPPALVTDPPLPPQEIPHLPHSRASVGHIHPQHVPNTIEDVTFNEASPSTVPLSPRKATPFATLSSRSLTTSSLEKTMSSSSSVMLENKEGKVEISTPFAPLDPIPGVSPPSPPFEPPADDSTVGAAASPSVEDTFTGSSSASISVLSPRDRAKTANEE